MGRGSRQHYGSSQALDALLGGDQSRSHPAWAGPRPRPRLDDHQQRLTELAEQLEQASAYDELADVYWNYDLAAVASCLYLSAPELHRLLTADDQRALADSWSRAITDTDDQLYEGQFDDGDYVEHLIFNLNDVTCDHIGAFCADHAETTLEQILGSAQAAAVLNRVGDDCRQGTWWRDWLTGASTMDDPARSLWDYAHAK